MESKIRYFTTPIYYANGKPHAGHVYATLLVSILKKHYLTRGFLVKSLTGLDEHGEAVQEKAHEMGLTPQGLVDAMAQDWQKDFAALNLDFDIFLRTTSPSHINNVQQILSHCYKNEDIYFGEHEGHYCVKCEGFLTTSERDENHFCLIHKRKTEARKEGNYFFKISKYKKILLELISQGHIVEQERYKNELLNMLESFQGDLSISRPKSRLTWGIDLPFDSEHVTYVWFDALPNYVTGIGGLCEAKESKYWQ
ncbi:MAG: class I tRNA ligase family protein, partial [Silvanigrellaceae bacterium]|nr:class I tRNA ligase family protein [Silvanigrellaceae bacterium]